MLVCLVLALRNMIFLNGWEVEHNGDLRLVFYWVTWSYKA